MMSVEPGHDRQHSTNNTTSLKVETLRQEYPHLEVLTDGWDRQVSLGRGEERRERRRRERGKEEERGSEKEKGNQRVEKESTSSPPLLTCNRLTNVAIIAWHGAV